MAMLPKKRKCGTNWYRPVKEFETAAAAEVYRKVLIAKNR